MAPHFCAVLSVLILRVNKLSNKHSCLLFWKKKKKRKENKYIKTQKWDAPCKNVFGHMQTAKDQISMRLRCPQTESFDTRMRLRVYRMMWIRTFCTCSKTLFRLTRLKWHIHESYFSGYFEFRICEHNDMETPATQSCFDNGTLLTVHETDLTRYDINDVVQVDYYFQLDMPRHVTCTQCILQWKYNAGTVNVLEFRTKFNNYFTCCPKF